MPMAPQTGIVFGIVVADAPCGGLIGVSLCTHGPRCARSHAAIAHGSAKCSIPPCRQFGKSSGGHLFPDKLTEDEKQAVLEYLKT